MVFLVGNAEVGIVDTAKYLEVWLDQGRTFQVNVQKAVNTCAAMARLMSRIYRLPLKCLKF